MIKLIFNFFLPKFPSPSIDKLVGSNIADRADLNYRLKKIGLGGL